jgi:hypothetical protein
LLALLGSITMKVRKGLRLAAGTTLAFFIALQSASAATLTVGPGRMYAGPAAAAAAAQDGDTIQIYPGTYSGAVWMKPNLIIEGMGAGATITGPVQLGKALFVIHGANVTVKNLTFTGAKNSAGNGAGIRQENTGLSIVNSKFTQNQNGILTNNDTTITLSVTGSTFAGNGHCGGSCAHAIYAGHIASLTVTNSTFINTKQGHNIKSRALSTTIVGNSITDGPNGTSSYLVDIPNGGALTMTGNTLEKGPHSSNYSIAIDLGEEGATNPVGPMLIANNNFRNDGKPTVFVHNQTGNAGLQLSNNLLTGNKTTMLTGKGTVSGPAAALFAALAAPVDVPEPSGLWIFGAALLGAFLKRWAWAKFSL